jgi:hypothetical protein
MLLDAIVLILNAQNVELSATLKIHLPAGGRLDMPVLDWFAAIVIVILVGGLVALQRWAWVGIMLIVGLGLAVGIWLYFDSKVPGSGNEPRYANMLVNVIVVFYLNQRGVQAAFTGPRKRVH